jgi:hypothetical protein
VLLAAPPFFIRVRGACASLRVRSTGSAGGCQTLKV